MCVSLTLVSFKRGGRDSSVGIATRCGLDGPGFEFGGAKFSEPVHTVPEAHPASCKMGSGPLPRG